MIVQQLASAPLLAKALFTQVDTSGTLAPLTEKLIIALVSAILSLLGGYILLQLKERREAQKRLSYNLGIRNVLDVDDVISKDIEVRYKSRPAGQISFVSCDIQNTGNRVVKEQFFRFVFGDSSTVLHAYLDPSPPREFGVAEITEDTLPPSERKFVIKHIERDQRVGFRFVVAGKLEGGVKVFPHNESGDVEVLPGTVSKARDDRESFERFIVFFVIGLIVPPIFYQLPDEVGDLAGFLLSFMIVLILLPLLRPTARVIASGLVTLGRAGGAPSVSIDTLHQEPNSELTIAVGSTASILRSATEPGAMQSASAPAESIDTTSR